MLRLGAAKVSLSSLTSEDLWQRSGRLDKGRMSELLSLEDRKGTKYLLSPTHEEEITTIFANAVKSYKELPLRLYQVSRKYRDEPRPRQGLLRGREFVMKDLYTFDATEEQARKTYDEVRSAYVAFLEDLRLPYLTARADSGNMGGNLSHEYHFASPFGEDTIINCDTCDHSLNEELYVGKHDPHYQPRPTQAGPKPASSKVAVQHYLCKDKKKLCTTYYPANEGEPNIYAVKALFPSVDPGAQVDAVPEEWLSGPEAKHCVTFRDPRLSESSLEQHWKEHPTSMQQTPQVSTVSGKVITLTKVREGDACPNCNQGKVMLHQAVEIGHTFHLGTRYSIPLDAHVLDSNNQQVPVQMGCHGIGVSRLVGAAASLLADKKGLNWPLAIAPFGVLVVPAARIDASDLEAVYDRLAAPSGSEHDLDVAIDDRDHEVGWKLNDADLVGYPFIVVIGRAWKSRRAIELQCRRLGVNEEVLVHELESRIRKYSKEL